MGVIRARMRMRMRRMSMGIIAMRTTAVSMWTGPRQRHGRVDGLPWRVTCHAHACTWLAIVHGRAMFCHGRAMGLPAHGMVRHFIDLAFGRYMAMPRCAIVREYIAIGGLRANTLDLYNRALGCDGHVMSCDLVTPCVH